MVASLTVRKLLLERKFLLEQRAALLVEVDRKIAEVEIALNSIGDGQDFADDGQLVTFTPSSTGEKKDMTVMEYLLHAIEIDGTLDYGRCAEFFYAENNARNRQCIHTALFHLKRKGKIERVSKGVWALREQKKRGRPPKAKPDEQAE